MLPPENSQFCSVRSQWTQQFHSGTDKPHVSAEYISWYSYNFLYIIDLSLFPVIWEKFIIIYIIIYILNLFPVCSEEGNHVCILGRHDTASFQDIHKQWSEDEWSISETTIYESRTTFRLAAWASKKYIHELPQQININQLYRIHSYPQGCQLKCESLAAMSGIVLATVGFFAATQRQLTSFL